MAHAFDTGLPKAQRTIVRQRAIDLLAGLKVAGGGYLQAVIPFGGVVRSWQDADGINLLITALGGRQPAIAVAVGDKGILPGGMGGFQYRGELELLVYHYATSLRDLELGRLEIDAVGLASNAADPGLDVQMEHAEELLIGQLGSATNDTVQGIRPSREEELFTDPEGTLWLQTYSIQCTRTINEFRTVSQLIVDFRTRLKLDPTEVNLPASPTKGGTIDVYTDDPEI